MRHRGKRRDENETMVSIQCKVVTVSLACEYQILTCYSIADNTGTITLCCWDKNINHVQELTEYSLKFQNWYYIEEQQFDFHDNEC